MRAQEGHAVVLIGIQPQPHPDQVQMIRHETVRRAKQSLTRGGVQHEFAKRDVKRFIKPALLAMRDGKRPMHHRIALIIFEGKTRQIKRPVEVRFVHENGVAAEVTRLKLKKEEKSELARLGIECARLRENDLRRSSRREEAQIKTEIQSEPRALGCYEI